MFRLSIFILILFFPFLSFSLKISEIYFDGTNEFIWIYNDTNQYFSWNVVIKWVKSSDLNVDIQVSTGEEIILGDDLSKIITWVNAYQTGLKLSISDSKAINITLIDKDWNVLDSFDVSTWDVQNLDNKKTSFEKILSWNIWQIQSVKQVRNNQDGYTVNPWYVFLGNVGQSWVCSLTLEKTDKYKFTYKWDYSDIVWYQDKHNIWSGQSVSVNLSTWNYLIEWVWKDSDGNVCTGTYWVFIEKGSSDIFTGKLQITEVYPKNGKFSEYVELKAYGNVSWDYVLKWFWRWSSELNLNLKLFSWNSVLLSKSYSWFLYTWNVLLFDKLNLLDNGETLTIFQNGQDIDKIKFSKWESLYFSSLSWDTRYFETNKSPTPWYDLYIKDYYKTDKKVDLDCSIYMQSYELKDDKIKINFDSNVSDSDFCKDNYRQTWTYSGWVSTWTCNPSYFYLSTWNQNIQFKIENNSWDILCEDNFKLLYFKEEATQENLNCYIKIQSKDDYFLSNSSINFITVVNGKEIQNSNTNYTCSYTLSWEVLSNKCNPDSLKMSWWLHTIDLVVKSKTWPTCQNTYYLNLPSENTKTVTKNPDPYACKKMSSDKLKQLTELVKGKYKSESTMKKIYNPIKYLYVKEDENLIDSCVKLNSDNLKILVSKIKSKYKSQYTLDKIFWKQKRTYKKISKYNIKIVWLLPYPKKWDKEQIILSGQYLSWLSISNWTRQYNLTTYSKSRDNYIFRWKFGLTNTKDCINLMYSGDVLDSVCYIWTKQNIVQSKFYRTDGILFEKDFIIFDQWWKLKIKENTPFKDLKTRLKKAIPKLVAFFKKLKKFEQTYKKRYVKESLESVKNRTRYLDLKIRYKKLKKDFAEYKKKKVDIVQSKNKWIKILKNQISFLKSFILYVKSNIDKKVYKDYLDKYRQVKKWQKIRY